MDKRLETVWREGREWCTFLFVWNNIFLKIFYLKKKIENKLINPTCHLELSMNFEILVFDMNTPTVSTNPLPALWVQYKGMIGDIKMLYEF